MSCSSRALLSRQAIGCSIKTRRKCLSNSLLQNDSILYKTVGCLRCPTVRQFGNGLLMEKTVLNTELSKEQRHNTVDHTWPRSQNGLTPTLCVLNYSVLYSTMNNAVKRNKTHVRDRVQEWSMRRIFYFQSEN
jgi:hypothetical protein